MVVIAFLDKGVTFVIVRVRRNELCLYSLFCEIVIEIIFKTDCFIARVVVREDCCADDIKRWIVADGLDRVRVNERARYVRMTYLQVTRIVFKEHG